MLARQDSRITALHAASQPVGTSLATLPSRPGTVKARSTPKRGRRQVENDEYAAFVRRILRAYARRVGNGDVEALSLMADLADEIDTAIAEAVKGPARLRLLLDRDRCPARRHPPGRSATLGDSVGKQGAQGSGSLTTHTLSSYLATGSCN